MPWSYDYGLRRADPPSPIDRKTTRGTATITNGLLTAYVMQLVERGEFSLDTPVARQLGKTLDQFDHYCDKASANVRESAWERVTPRMLLAHAPGSLNFPFIEPDGKMHLHFEPGTM